MTETPADQSPPMPRFDAWIVMLITLAVFALVLWTPYSLIDDRLMLRDNAELTAPSAAGFLKQLNAPQHNIYAPLTFGLWYVIAAITTDGTAVPAIGFKVASWLAHGLAGAAAWWVIWILVPNRWAAMIGALAVVLHPLQVESVAWTTGTKDILCGVFSFAAIALYLRAIQGQGRKTLYWSVTCGALAVAAKPTGVVLPAILVVADFAVRSVPLKRRARDLWPFVPVSIIGIAIILTVQHAADVEAQPLWARPLIAADSLSFYIRKLLVPWPILVDYARLPDWVRASGQLAWTWTIPLLALVAILLMRHRLAVLAGAVFAIPILPVSGLIMFDMQQYSTVADHYAYQSLLGAGLLIAMILARSPWWRGVGVIVVAAWAGLSVWHLNIWRDPPRLYGRAVERVPHGVMSRGAMTVVATDSGDLAKAERLLRELVAEHPRVDAYTNLTGVLLAQRRLPEAAETAKKALAFHSRKVDIRTTRVWLDLAARVNDTDLALAAAHHWAGLEPANPAARRLIAQINAARARDAATRPATQP